MRILWIDDDALGLLRPAQLMLHRKTGSPIVVRETYREGIEFLAENQHPQNRRVTSLLADVILPRSDTNEALSPYLGLKLADRAPSFGVTTVAFLTVVPIAEIREQFRALEVRHPSVMFTYWNKLSMLAQGRLEAIAASLVPPSQLTVDEAPEE